MSCCSSKWNGCQLATCCRVLRPDSLSVYQALPAQQTVFTTCFLLSTLITLLQPRSAGLPVSAETCPHYLMFAAEDVPDGSTAFKCAPPIRNAANQEALWQGLLKGTLDSLATDHSPAPPEMKSLDTGDFLSAWGGIAGRLSIPLSLLVVSLWRAIMHTWSLCAGRAWTGLG